MFLHRDFCDRDTLTHRCHYKQRFSYKGMHLHEELSHTDVLTQTYSYMICHGGHPCPAKGFSKQMQSRKFTADFDNRGAKGLREQKQNRKFTVFFNAISARASTQNRPNAKSRNFTSVLAIKTHFVRKGLRKTIETQKAQCPCSFWGLRRISWERVGPA